MKKVLSVVVLLSAMSIGGLLLLPVISCAAESASAGSEKIVQSGAILTVAESKRLIGKAVAQMPIVKKPLPTAWSLSSRGRPMLTWQRR